MYLKTTVVHYLGVIHLIGNLAHPGKLFVDSVVVYFVKSTFENTNIAKSLEILRTYFNTVIRVYVSSFQIFKAAIVKSGHQLTTSRPNVILPNNLKRVMVYHCE